VKVRSIAIAAGAIHLFLLKTAVDWPLADTYGIGGFSSYCKANMIHQISSRVSLIIGRNGLTSGEWSQGDFRYLCSYTGAYL
jgi:hypothetical protein